MGCCSTQFFDTFKAKGFDISIPGTPGVHKDSIHIQAAIRSEKVLLVLKGGWLDQLNATRRLPKTSLSCSVTKAAVFTSSLSAVTLVA